MSALELTEQRFQILDELYRFCAAVSLNLETAHKATSRIYPELIKKLQEGKDLHLALRVAVLKHVGTDDLKTSQEALWPELVPLTPLQRFIFVAIDIFGDLPEDVAKAVSFDVDTIRSHLAAARRILCRS